MIVKGVDVSGFANHAVTWWSRQKTARLEKERIWQECWLASVSKFGKTWDNLQDFRSKRYIPITQQAVEAVAAHLTQGVMPYDEWFQIYGRTPDDEPKAKANQGLLMWQHQQTGFRTKFHQLVKYATIFGNVPYCVTWTERKQQIPDQQAFMSQLQQAGQMAQMTGESVPNPDLSAMPMLDQRVYDGPDLEIGNIFDFVIERHPNNPEHAPRAMRSFKSKAFLMDMVNEDGYSVYEGVEDVRPHDGQNEPSDGLKREVYRLEGFIEQPKDQVELLQFEGDLELPGPDGELVLYKNHILVVANRNKVIRFEPNPFAHGRCSWNMFVLYPEPGEAYGRGIVEPALGLQDVVNVRANQVIEANTLIINPAYSVVQDGVFDANEWLSAPGAVNFVAQQGNIQPLQQVPQAALGFQEIGFMMSQHNQSTGAQASFTSEAYQKSATEVAASSGMTQSRNAETIKHIEYNCLTPIIRMQMQLNQQLMDEAVWIRVVGDPQTMTVFDPNSGQPVQQSGPAGPVQLKVSPQDIEGNFDCFAVGASNVANSQQQMGQTIQLLSVLAQSPAAAVIKWDELARDLFSLARVRDSWKFIKSQQEQQLEQQQQFAQQLAMQQAGQGPTQGPDNGGGPNSAGSQPGPSGVSSMAGMAEQHSAPTNGPQPGQLGGSRLL
jgi:hypothetical protein